MSDFYLGLMSGTSLDGLDIALCEIDESGHTSLVQSHSAPLPLALRTLLQALTQPGTDELNIYASCDREFAAFCAQHILHFLRQANVPASRIRAIGSHGQTVRHMPVATPAYTLQLGCASTLASLTGIDVVADFRRKDIALGGQGAPLTPAFHKAMLGGDAVSRAVLNIGGIANLTLFTEDKQTLGFDTGPGNCLLDAWYTRHHPHQGRYFDHDGGFAQSGQINQASLERMLEDPYFRQPAPKSTGREYFHLDWVEQKLAADDPDPADIQRTLLELTAVTIGTPLREHALRECFVCGGGVHNSALLDRLRALTPDVTFASTAELGIEPDWVEAMAFAWLAWSHIEKRPSNLPEVTGATRAAILGGYFPAH